VTLRQKTCSQRYMNHILEKQVVKVDILSAVFLCDFVTDTSLWNSYKLHTSGAQNKEFSDLHPPRLDKFLKAPIYFPCLDFGLASMNIIACEQLQRSAENSRPMQRFSDVFDTSSAEVFSKTKCFVTISWTLLHIEQIFFREVPTPNRWALYWKVGSKTVSHEQNCQRLLSQLIENVALLCNCKTWK